MDIKEYLENLGLKYGKDFNDETIKEFSDGKGEDKDE